METILSKEASLYCVATANEGVFLEYHLFESEDGYGVRIIKKSGDTLIEQAEIPSVCIDLCTAKALLQQLFQSTVTPITLKEVLEDWVDMQTFVCYT